MGGIAGYLIGGKLLWCSFSVSYMEVVLSLL